jgi:hypothetical protein
MMELILSNLVLISQFMALFALAWLSNMVLSLWFNIKILGEIFDPKRLIDGVYKLLVLCIGVALFSVLLTTAPIVFEHYGIVTIEEDIATTFDFLAVAVLFAVKGIIPYAKETYKTLNNIIESIKPIE